MVSQCRRYTGNAPVLGISKRVPKVMTDRTVRLVRINQSLLTEIVEEMG